MAFIMTTRDDGVEPTEKLQGTDVVQIGWAIPTNQHTREVPEYEAGVMTYYKGANGLETGLPAKKWSMRQTVTKVLNMYSGYTLSKLIIPKQTGASLKEIELGQEDPAPEEFWYWPQELTQESPTQVVFQLQRASTTPNMVIKAGSII